jgi:hypothetical protein
MNRITTLLLSALVACSSQNRDSTKTEQTTKDSSIASNKSSDQDNEFITSVYDNPNDHVQQQQAKLKELSDSSVFKVIHSKLFETVSKEHQDFFAAHSDYQLICTFSGDLFNNNTAGRVFIVYDNRNVRITFLTFDESTKKYSELYRDIKVRNELKNANCNYGAFGTLDYQFANELILEQDLIKKPERFLEYPHGKITDIHSDSDMILESGCFSKSFKPAAGLKSLCLPTSFVYNNWECLMYHKTSNSFIIFYGQAFAD